MTDDDLAISREDEERALYECMRLGYMTIGPDGEAVITVNTIASRPRYGCTVVNVADLYRSVLSRFAPWVR